MNDTKTASITDPLIEEAMEAALAKGVPLAGIVNRLGTYFGAYSCLANGSAATARDFRAYAEKIDNGLFKKVTGEMASH